VSLDQEKEREVDALWAPEIERRCADLDAGRTTTSDWEEVRRRIEKEIFKR
jgi:putative addiction module component (TIGR02574 family)